MKKNISINLFGTLYAIDEDAYNMLERYIDSMKSYFARQEGGAEIADDIEHRVAELLWQRKEAGAQTVNIDDVKEIIRIIGNPAEIASDTDTNDNTEENKHNDETNDTYETNDYSREESNSKAYASSFYERIRSNVRGKKLFRNSNDKMLAGVCSGLATYVGIGDVIVWRIGTILLTLFMPYLGGIIENTLLRWIFGWWTRDYQIPFFITFAIPITYLLLWILVPYAVTPEDVLRMKGKDVNPQNLNEEIINDSATTDARTIANTSGAYNKGGKSHGGCLFALVGGGCLSILLFPFVLIILISLIFAVGMTVFSTVFSFGPEADNVFSVMGAAAECSRLVWLGLICGIIVVVIPVVMLVRKMTTGTWKLSRTSATFVTVTWVLALVCFVFAWIYGSRKFNEIAKSKVDFNTFVESVADVVEENVDVDYLQEEGWEVVTKKNCIDGRVTSQGRYMTGDYNVHYLDADVRNRRGAMLFTARKSEYLEKGLYRVYAECRASQDGAYIYAAMDVDLDSVISASMIPAYGDKGGNIFAYASDDSYGRDKNVRRWVDSLKNVQSTMCDDSGVLLSVSDAVKQANEGKGYGWSYVCVDSIRMEEDGLLYYGVTTNSNVVGKHVGNGKEAKNNYRGLVSAHNFKVERIGDLPNK